MIRSLLRDIVARDRAVERAIADQRARQRARPTAAPVRCRKCGEDDARTCDCTLIRLGGDE
jgi:hypothetical protein